MRWPDDGGKRRSTRHCWSRMELNCHMENLSSILGRSCQVKFHHSAGHFPSGFGSANFPSAMSAIGHKQNPSPAYEGMGTVAMRRGKEAFASYLLPGLGGKFLNNLFTAL